MIIYPAMDLLDGQVVRLSQGSFDDVTAYSTPPREALEQFSAAGAEWAHVVDLDGARAGAPVQHGLIGELARCSPLNLQVAGGFRTRQDLQRMFDAGAARIVIGSLALKEPEMVRALFDEFGPERIALSLDVRLVENKPVIALSGWTEDSGRSLWDIADYYREARHLLVTDIARDGMLQGPNLDLYDELARRLPDVAVQASGGVSFIADLKRLPTAGAIIGRALWEGRISLEEALHCARA